MTWKYKTYRKGTLTHIWAPENRQLGGAAKSIVDVHVV